MQAEIHFFLVFEDFWQEAPEIEGFKADYAALYFALIDSINSNGDGSLWKETEVEYDRIINKVRMGKRMFLESRTWLVNYGFLTYTPGRNEYSKARYFLGSEVQKRTADEAERRKLVVQKRTATGTTKPKDEVQKRTASDTSTNTTASTADVTEYIEETLDLETLDVSGTVEKDKNFYRPDEIPAFVEKNRNQIRKEVPPPTADEVKAELLDNSQAREHSELKIKDLKGEKDYLELVEHFIRVNVGKRKSWSTLHDALSHFFAFVSSLNGFNPAKQETDAKSGKQSRSSGPYIPVHPEAGRATGTQAKNWRHIEL